jgi:hypothetical protein
LKTSRGLLKPVPGFIEYDPILFAGQQICTSLRYSGMRLILICSMTLLFLACKKSEKQKAVVNMEFQTIAGQTAYTFSEYFTNGDGVKLRIEVLQFYISNIRFASKKGEETVAADIALITCGVDGKGSVSVKIPAGDYTALRFGIGVPEAMNEKGPGAFTEPDHPLSATQNTYWGMNSMYRFVMIDGKYDVNGDGADEGGFSYHTGFKDCYRTFELIQEFSFDRKENYTIPFTIDITKLFYVPGSMIDVTTESNFHGDYANIGLAERLSDNFAVSLGIQ